MKKRISIIVIFTIFFVGSIQYNYANPRFWDQETSTNAKGISPNNIELRENMQTEECLQAYKTVELSNNEMKEMTVAAEIRSVNILGIWDSQYPKGSRWFWQH